MTAAASGDAVVTPTLDDVESRLRSLEFLFSGSSNFAGQAIPPAKPQSHHETIADAGDHVGSVDLRRYRTGRGAEGAH